MFSNIQLAKSEVPINVDSQNTKNRINIAISILFALNPFRSIWFAVLIISVNVIPNEYKNAFAGLAQFGIYLICMHSFKSLEGAALAVFSCIVCHQSERAYRVFSVFQTHFLSHNLQLTFYKLWTFLVMH